MTPLLLLVALAMTFVAAVLSGFETGIYGLSHIRLRYRMSIGDARAGVIERMLSRPEQLISGILVAQNVAVYIVTAIVASLLESWGVHGAEAWTTVSLAVIFFIFVDAVPKNVFLRSSDVLVYPLARPMSFLMAATRPAGAALRAVMAAAARLAPGRRGEVVNQFFTRERLNFYLREGHSQGTLTKYQMELTDKILHGERVTVARAMVPMTRVEAVAAEATLEECLKISRETRFSRYPVYKGDKSTVIGVINIYDCRLRDEGAFDTADYLRPAVFFAPEAHVTEALRVLRESRQPMGIVAVGGRALGIVTMKDCLEEIVGELYAW